VALAKEKLVFFCIFLFDILTQFVSSKKDAFFVVGAALFKENL
jgi:hypothetical protein